MTRTPPTDVVAGVWADQVQALATEHHREAAHRVFMAAAMHLTERLIGVPYGPALCEVRPPKLRGLMITGDPRNRRRR